MCIRDRCAHGLQGSDWAVIAKKMKQAIDHRRGVIESLKACLLYTSDAADERSSVDLGGRGIIKKKNSEEIGAEWRWVRET